LAEKSLGLGGKSVATLFWAVSFNNAYGFQQLEDIYRLLAISPPFSIDTDVMDSAAKEEGMGFDESMRQGNPQGSAREDGEPGIGQDKLKRKGKTKNVYSISFTKRVLVARSLTNTMQEAEDFRQYMWQHVRLALLGREAVPPAVWAT
jgi:hypothetical protein